MLYDAIAPIRVQPVNQGTGAASLDYSIVPVPPGVRVIAVGGNSLSRGLTLEGLCVSYFMRNSKAYDTLLQMSRWFGYRDDYHEFCRVWLSPDAEGWYRHIADATKELRRDFARMRRQRATPAEFGLRVRTHPDTLLITARNKMATGVNLVGEVRDISLAGRGIETARLYADQQRNEDNFKIVDRFLSDLVDHPRDAVRSPNGNAVLWRDVPADMIRQLLLEFLVHPQNHDFQGDAIAEFLADAVARGDPQLSTWTVAVPVEGNKVSRFANSQNSVRASDFFANHEFHRRMEGISRRILAPAVGSSQVQTHWYYERARGQHLNDQAGMTAGKKEQFLRRNPRHQVITKTDLAKVENCFDLLPDIACKGAEKSFTEFAERITKEWQDERKRSLYSDDWYRAAVARTILFRTTEALVSKAPWYEGGYRAQIVAYAAGRLSALAMQQSGGGRLDYLKIWASQAAGDGLERQLLAIAEAMMQVLRSPPQAGQNISEWAKQQACRKTALETEIPADPALDDLLVAPSDARAADREERDKQRVSDGLTALTTVVALGAETWQSVRSFADEKRLLTAEDGAALTIACAIPRRVPTDRQATRLLLIKRRCEEAGYEPPAAGSLADAVL